MANESPSTDPAVVLFRLISQYFDGEVTVEEIAKTTGFTARTIWRRIKAHRQKGLSGLTRARRNDKGKRRGLSTHLQEVIEGLYLKTPKPTVVWVREQVVAACERDRIKPPSYTVVSEICRNLDKRLKVLAHDGEAAYEQEFDIIIRRQAKHPNEMWQGDHKELDIWAVDEHGKVGKVWLTGIVDDFSRVVPGYFLGIGPGNSMKIASALRQAIWRKDDERWPVCGIPEIFYTDRGRDFKSTHIEQACADLGIRLVRTKRRKPRGKGKIERLFRTTDQRFASRRKSSREAPLDLAQLRSDFHEWLMLDYHQRTHREIKKAPMTKWNEAKCMPNMPDSLDALNLMLQKVEKERKMCGEGIRFKTHIYSDMLLSECVGQKFTIRYDPRDYSSIWVYAEEGKLFCQARCEELTGVATDPEMIISTRTRIKKGLKNQITRRNKAADSYVAPNETPPAGEKSPTSSTPMPIPITIKLRRHSYERKQ